MMILVGNATQALLDYLGGESSAPVQSFEWWLGLVLFDALAPLHGEPELMEKWPDWPRRDLGNGRTFRLLTVTLELDR